MAGHHVLNGILGVVEAHAAQVAGLVAARHVGGGDGGLVLGGGVHGGIECGVAQGEGVVVGKGGVKVQRFVVHVHLQAVEMAGIEMGVDGKVFRLRFEVMVVEGGIVGGHQSEDVIVLLGVDVHPLEGSRTGLENEVAIQEVVVKVGRIDHVGHDDTLFGNRIIGSF